MRELHLFAGIGGGILGGMLLGHSPVCAVEIDPYCRKVLKQRMLDGFLPADMHIHDDIRTFDGTQWQGKVDVVAGGFPCQDLSIAGKRAGLDGERSGLFFELMRVVREVRPQYIFLENVPGLITKGIDRVLGEVAEIGFDAAWTVLSASDCGANHQRKRVWILCRNVDDSAGDRCHAAQNVEGVDSRDGRDQAREEVAEQSSRPSVLGKNVRRSQAEDVADPDGKGSEEPVLFQGCRDQKAGVRQADGPRGACPPLADSISNGSQGRVSGRQNQERQSELGQTGHSCAIHGQPAEGWWAVEPDLGRLAHGIPDKVGRLRALGNAQVPLVAASAWIVLDRMLRSNE